MHRKMSSLRLSEFVCSVKVFSLTDGELWGAFLTEDSCALVCGYVDGGFYSGPRVLHGRTLLGFFFAPMAHIVGRGESSY